MTIKNLVQKLTAASNVKGINAKKELLNNLSINEQTGLRYILDPNITFGVKKPLKNHSASPDAHLDDTVVFSILERLARRELTGNSAKTALESFALKCSADQYYFMQLALKKSSGCGVGVNATNQLYPGLIPTFTVSKGKTYTTKLFHAWERGTMLSTCEHVMVQMKENGWRVLAKVNFKTCTVNYCTYTGNPISTITHLDSATLTLAYLLKSNEERPFGDVVWIDGEGVYINDDGSMGTLQQAASALGNNRDEVQANIQFRVFDYFSDEDFQNGKESIPKSCEQRFRLLEKAVTELNQTPSHKNRCTLVQNWFVKTEEEIFDIASSIISSGGEGVMVKHADKPLVFKKHSDWLKLKSIETFDGTVLEVLKGDVGKQFESTMGRLAIQLEENNSIVYCGGGFSRNLRDQIMQDPDAYVGRCIELTAQEMTPDGSLQHARFSRFRDRSSLIGEKC